MSRAVIDLLEPNYIHPWFRRGSVHLISGTSGSGKTRLLSQLMEALQGGAPTWMGLPLQAQPFVYVATDRPMNLVREVWERMKISNWQAFPYVPAFDEDMSLRGTWQKAAKIIKPDAALFIVEHWTRYVGSSKNDPRLVSNYMCDAGRWCDQNDYTVIGVMEECKAKRDKDRYEDPRQRLSGVAEWGHLADTVMNIDLVDRKNPANPYRKLYISDHNHLGRTFDLVFDDTGRLILDVGTFCETLHKPVKQQP